MIRIFRRMKSISLKFFILLWFFIILYYGIIEYRVHNDYLAQFVTPYENLIFSDDNVDLSTSSDIINSTIYHNLFLKSNYLYQFLVNFDYNDRCDIYFNEAYRNKEGDKPIVDPNEKIDFQGKFFKPLSKYVEDELNNVKNNRKQEAKNKKLKLLIDKKIWKLKQEKYQQLIEFDPDIDVDSIQISQEDSYIDPNSIEINDDEIEFDLELETKIATSAYNDNWVKIKVDEQSLHDFITHTKIFNRCFLSTKTEKYQNNIFVKNQQKALKQMKLKIDYLNAPTVKLYQNCRILEQQIYPWLTQKFPSFYQVLTGKYKEFTYTSDSECFLNAFHNQLSGKGIVITLSNDHISLFIRLLHLLKALGNELPIELIHKNDLTQESLDNIVNAVADTRQDVWLVDMLPAVTEDFQDKFEGYGNKVVASLLNSFEEMMLIDADTVLLKSPEFFFNMKKYVKSGTLFFKDRTTPEFRNDHDLKFFDKLFNSQVDEIAFNLHRVSNHTLDREFFSRKQGHYMESGVVLVDRHRHFQQPLFMCLLIFFSPITNRVYGDKELFWLSLAFYGDENYEFNDNFAAAIGEITSNEERFYNQDGDRELLSKEICSNHPGHISDEDNHTLLWFNSGFKFCGQVHKVNFEAEFRDKSRYSRFKTVQQFETFFRSKLLIREAIIPPQKILTTSNNIGEPNIGWFNMRQYCSGYTWCGYSSMGFAEESKDQVGTIIYYTKEEQKHFDALGDIWIKEYKY